MASNTRANLDVIRETWESWRMTKQFSVTWGISANVHAAWDAEHASVLLVKAFDPERYWMRNALS